MNYEAVTPPPVWWSLMQMVRMPQMRWPTLDEPDVDANESSPCQWWPGWLWLSAQGLLSWQLFYKCFPPLPPYLCGLQTELKMDSGSHSFSLQIKESRIMGEWVNRTLEIHPPLASKTDDYEVCTYRLWVWLFLCKRQLSSLCAHLLFPERTKKTFVMSLQLPAHPLVIGQTAV